MELLINPTDSLFTSGAQVLVNPVNCVGVMGAGLAKVFATRWPRMTASYRDLCRRQELRPGGVDTHLVATELYVVNLATKDHWRNPSRIEWVDQGLTALAAWLADPRVPAAVLPVGDTTLTIASPALGCGLGGLDFDEVLPLFPARLGHLPNLRVCVYSPR